MHVLNKTKSVNVKILDMIRGIIETKKVNHFLVVVNAMSIVEN